MTRARKPHAGTLIPWATLRVYGSDGAPLYGTHARRALTRWRSGRALLLTVRHESAEVVSPAAVDWTGWVDEPGRRGGPSGVVPESQRGTDKIQLRVPLDLAARIDAVLEDGETRQDLARLGILAEIERRTPQPKKAAK